MAFRAQVKVVCDLYGQAPELLAAGLHVISSDEMTGIQALERAYPTKSVQMEQAERQEYEYIRHGTQSLIANWQVATGTVLTPSIATTRNEADFAAHIVQTLANDPQAAWIFILDQLNTHKSETLVRLVDRLCDLKLDLGQKEQSGILQSMPTRAAFLSVQATVSALFMCRSILPGSTRLSVGSVFSCVVSSNGGISPRPMTCDNRFWISLLTSIAHWPSPLTGSSKAFLIWIKLLSYFSQPALVARLCGRGNRGG